jgi:hypothetical protein
MTLATESFTALMERLRTYVKLISSEIPSDEVI